MRPVGLLLAIAALPPSLVAQQSPPIIAIRAGTLIDGTGAAPMRNAVIVVRGERIAAVGTGVAIPKGATVVDLSGETVLPGFIDAHVHLTQRTIGDGDWQHSTVTELPSQIALLGAAHAQQTLEAGFTTVRLVGASGFADIGLRNAIDAGWVPGPRILGAGLALGARGGHCDDTAGFNPGTFGHEAGIEEGVADGVDQVRSAVRYQVKYGADVIKICATGGVLSPTGRGRRPAVHRGGDARHRGDRHAARAQGGRARARRRGHQGGRAGRRGLDRARLVPGQRGASQLMKEHGTYLVPTLLAGFTVESLATAKQLPAAMVAKALAIGAADARLPSSWRSTPASRSRSAPTRA